MTAKPQSFPLAGVRPAARPVVTKHGNTFTPKTSLDSQRLVGAGFIQANPGWVIEPTARWAIFVLYWPPNKRRQDVDNLAKTIMDGLTGALYQDDGQVDDIHVRRVWEPRTHPAVGALVECYELPPREVTP